MAFTTISNISLDQGQGWATPYFHPEDIAMLLNQDGAVAVTPVNAIVKGQACVVLVGVREFLITETDITITRLAGADHFAALPCPPFNDRGGVFLTNPSPSPKTITILP